MEVHFSKSKLFEKIKSAKNIAPKKTTKPILQMVKLEAIDGEVWLSASDENFAYRGKVECEKIVEEGAMLLPLDKFEQTVKQLDSKRTIKIKGELGEDNTIESARITSHRTRIKLPCLPPDEFPEFPELNEESSFDFPCHLFQEMIHSTLFAVSEEENRYYLQGIFFSFEDLSTSAEDVRHVLRFVSTDGHRLSLCEIKQPENIPSNFIEASESRRLIVPKKLISSAQGITGEYESVQVSMDGSRMVFSTDEEVVVGNLLDGQFPDYHPVIPKKPKFTCRVNRVDLMVAVGRVSTFSPDKLGGLRLKVEKNEDGAFLSMSNQRAGSSSASASDEVRILEASSNLDDVEFEIGFNGLFLKEQLSVMKEQDIEISFTNKNNPALVVPFFPEEEKEEVQEIHRIGVVMPMRL